MQLAPMFAVRTVADPAALTAVARLRAAVWLSEDMVEPAACPGGECRDATDEEAIYLGVYGPTGDLVAAARLSFHASLEDSHEADYVRPYALDVPAPFALLSRLVVHRDARGRGVASTLDRLRLSLAREQGVAGVVAFPVERRVDALAALGFRSLGRLACRPELQQGLRVSCHAMALWY